MHKFKDFHDIPMIGHLGYYNTYKKICERFSWKGMKDDILKYFCECQVCQHNKNEHTYPVGLLQSLPIPTQKWESI